LGYKLIGDYEQADVVILNTCCVRRKAEERIFGQLGHLKGLRAKKEGLVIGVVGCMARGARDELLERAPFVDFMLDPDQLHRIPEELQRILQPVGLVEQVGAVASDVVLPNDRFPFKRHVPIMRGCDNYCSYCIVPYVRGRERSLEFEVVREIVEGHARADVREVTLLGQNVNSYSSDGVVFPQLLQRLAQSFPEVGFRFMTSHPKDLSDELIEVMGSFDNVLPHLHLPLQAGSNRILALMNRRYTQEHYCERLLRLRQRVPGIAITTDLICGFPSESEREFQETLELVEQIRYDSAFMFYYSPRQGTAAAAMADDPPQEVRKERLRRLIDLQRQISIEVNNRHVGEQVVTLVEQQSRRDLAVLATRTGTNKTLLIPGSADLIGQRVDAEIERVDAWTLFGKAL